MAYIEWSGLNRVYCSSSSDVLTVLNEAKAQKVQDLYRLWSGKNRLELQLDFVRNLFRPQIVIDGQDSRYYYNPEAPLKMVDFLDGYDGADILTSDFDLILSMVKEFYVTGDVKSLVPQEQFPEMPDDEDED